MTSPIVSVIIPTYNCKDYVQEAINSALAQTYQDFELIVVDDGSTDGTGEVLKRFHSRIRYVYQDNRGISAATNRGIRMASGQLIAFLDHDDLWVPHKLQCQVAYLDAHPDVALVCTRFSTIGYNGGYLKELEEPFGVPAGQVSFETIFWRCPVLTSTVLVRREALLQAGLFDETMRWGQDWDMWARLALQSAIVLMPESLVRYRIHAGNTYARLLSQPEEVDRWFSDVLRSKEKIYRHWPSGLGDIEEVKRRVTADHLARAAILNFAQGASNRGAERLQEAVRLDPERWADAVLLGDMAFPYAVELARERGQGSALQFLDAVFRYVPPEVVGAAHVKRRLVARLYVELAFLNHSLGRRREVWSHAVRGLWHDPRWLQNRGLLSISLQALFGRAPVTFLRHLRGGKDAQS